MPNLTTIATWAATMGISRQQGYAAVTRCAIPVTDGKVDTEYATLLYHRNTRPRANGKRDPAQTTAAASDGNQGSGAQPAPYDESRARREEAEASLAEMKLAEMTGKYLVKTDVDSAIFGIMRALRDGLMNCSRRLAADVATLSSADDCEAVIDREHRALLESMRHALLAQVGAAEESEAP
ncbi:hypothetical protein ASR47_1003375 [Janthinobacterium psychrotolerans]|uniref:Terminase small subunit n=2 Tax=Janthinobacterium psychrotolerans TaxID=1747903 RepID=A0A1A7BVX1_9BURK|nr:hypothetical protein ASR47_1003375 [Janthinobacterium psychrotolerans]